MRCKVRRAEGAPVPMDALRQTERYPEWHAKETLPIDGPRRVLETDGARSYEQYSEEWQWQGSR